MQADVDGDLLRHHEDQSRVEGVQQHVGLMVSPGFQTDNLADQRKGQYRQGVPIAAHRVQESPLYPLSVQTVLNLQIRNDIVWIIVVEEVMVKGLAEHEPHGQRQQQAARAIP